MCVYRETPCSSWILSLVILASVLILSTPVSVSLPYLPTFDMAHVRFNTTVTLKLKEGNTDIQELRVRTFFLLSMPMIEISFHSLVFGEISTVLNAYRRRTSIVFSNVGQLVSTTPPVLPHVWKLVSISRMLECLLIISYHRFRIHRSHV